MRKNAFTLIELLAVIVILAIIALIATPIILGIIKDAKDNANKRSIDMYAKAIENALVANQLDGKVGIVGSFKTLTLEENLKIEYDGSKIECNTIELYKDGNIYLDNCKVSGEPVKYSYGKDQTYDNGQIVYFDVVKGVGCKEEECKFSYDETINDYLNSKTGYNGYNNKELDNSNNEIKVEKTEKQNSCLKFYAFNDDINSNILNLLLDHNTTISVAWYRKHGNATNIYGPEDVLEYLYDDTKEWNTPIINKTYIVDQSTQISGTKYEIKYNEIPIATPNSTLYSGAKTPLKQD